jgi:phosphatidylserine/phosphatidylglycerophosphate/cardiolipin synthase-like enzyme
VPGERLIDVLTLTDGGQQPDVAASFISTFIATATKTLDIALYDLALRGDTCETIEKAVDDAVARGVVVRFVRNSSFGKPIPVPPPPHDDQSPLHAAEGEDIPGVPDLMHHKYVVRDGEAVLTGSTNWTQDSWTREENVLLVVVSTDIAAQYTRNFEELWTKHVVQDTGRYTMDPVDVDGALVRAWFCPGRGPRLAHRIADAIASATTRVRICSPVITSGPVLGTLCEIAAARKIDLSGCYDGTQMDDVLRQWRAEGQAVWKIHAFESLIATAPFGRKRSTPYSPAAVHDYMHAKVSVCDDRIFVGSYNLSHSGEENAENVLEISDAGLADRMTVFIDGVRARYSS